MNNKYMDFLIKIKDRDPKQVLKALILHLNKNKDIKDKAIVIINLIKITVSLISKKLKCKFHNSKIASLIQKATSYTWSWCLSAVCKVS